MLSPGQAAGVTVQCTKPAKEVVVSCNLAWELEVTCLHLNHIDLVFKELACQGRGCEKPAACPSPLVDLSVNN